MSTKTKKNIISRKISLILVGEKEEVKNSKNYLLTIIKELTCAGNEIIRKCVSNQFELDNLKKQNDLSDKEKLKNFMKEKGLDDISSSIYYDITTKYPHINTRVITLLLQSIRLKIEKTFFDVLNGKTSIPSFRVTSLPIPVEPVIKKEGEYYNFTFPMSLYGRKLYDTPKFGLKFGRDRSGNRVIIDRILDGTYKIAGSNIKMTEEKDFVLNLSVDIPITKTETINPDKIMGIDIGINRMVATHISGEERQPEQINIETKIQHERMKFRAHRRQIAKNLVSCKGGHGRKRKMQKLDSIRQKESNWAKLMNHEISKRVIDKALKYNVGTIKMEDLTGISTKKNDYFMKSWAYYQLQSFIEYKAKMAGIQILWVNPKGTSITCPNCKHEDPLNRNAEDKTKFACVNPVCSEYQDVKDADLVAALNISNTVGSLVKQKSKQGRIEKAKNKKQQEAISE